MIFLVLPICYLETDSEGSALPRISLTKSEITAIEPASREITYWDTAVPGFGLKVTPMGRKVFIVLYRTKGQGKLRKFTIGTFGELTPAKARETALGVLNARREGRDPVAEKKDEKQKARSDLVEDLIGEFIERHVSKRRSAKETIRIINREILPAWAGRSIHSITKADVVRLIDPVTDRGAPLMANRVFAAVRKFLNWCVSRAVIEVSPCLGLQPVSVESQRDRVLTDEELVRVISAARTIGGPYGAIVELLALTGQRREEVARMTRSEINLDERLWTLEGSRTKNGKPHSVHLCDRACEIVTDQPHIGHLVFTTNGTSPFQGFSRAKRQLDELADVSGWVLHDLRRTAVSGMARLGVAPHVADRILNHQSGSISGVAAVYQRYEFDEERRDALDLWAQHVANLLAGLGTDNVVPIRSLREA